MKHLLALLNDFEAELDRYWREPSEAQASSVVAAPQPESRNQSSLSEYDSRDGAAAESPFDERRPSPQLPTIQ